MLRDNLAGLIEPMLSSAGAYPLALCTEPKQSSDDRPPCLENPRPEGAESTLTENAASPFHAEPRQLWELPLAKLSRLACPRLAERELENGSLTWRHRSRR
jgi:hypothetical protein